MREPFVFIHFRDCDPRESILLNWKTGESQSFWLRWDSPETAGSEVLTNIDNAKFHPFREAILIRYTVPNSSGQGTTSVGRGKTTYLAELDIARLLRDHGMSIESSEEFSLTPLAHVDHTSIPGWQPASLLTTCPIQISGTSSWCLNFLLLPRVDELEVYSPDMDFPIPVLVSLRFSGGKESARLITSIPLPKDLQVPSLRILIPRRLPLQYDFVSWAKINYKIALLYCGADGLSPPCWVDFQLYCPSLGLGSAKNPTDGDWLRYHYYSVFDWPSGRFITVYRKLTVVQY
ncbi:hypothetical protein SISSUDRAFT_255372 [Sistotremastrum suecicum HHB10207 ss-3]|uniref:Uncharacterized protein n=1 Tax=Sistotremastrum suecicum HHB10207 ss-3 TaxID=1314776 RepID=A0A165ZUM8_9AGAM|nr:hypothetical protein SISSUDRAFT_255372 [Sistotremastrum suecicum HHB10207 ss-3]